MDDRTKILFSTVMSHSCVYMAEQHDELTLPQQLMLYSTASMLMEGYDCEASALDFMALLSSEDKPVLLNDYDIDDAINDVVCEIEWISMVASMRYIVLSNVPFI